jgi:hypothetical protein
MLPAIDPDFADFMDPDFADFMDPDLADFMEPDFADFIDPDFADFIEPDFADFIEPDFALLLPPMLFAVRLRRVRSITVSRKPVSPMNQTLTRRLLSLAALKKLRLRPIIVTYAN